MPCSKEKHRERQNDLELNPAGQGRLDPARQELLRQPNWAGKEDCMSTQAGEINFKMYACC